MRHFREPLQPLWICLIRNYGIFLFLGSTKPKSAITARTGTRNVTRKLSSASHLWYDSLVWDTANQLVELVSWQKTWDKVIAIVALGNMQSWMGVLHKQENLHGHLWWWLLLSYDSEGFIITMAWFPLFRSIQFLPSLLCFSSFK